MTLLPRTLCLLLRQRHLSGEAAVEVEHRAGHELRPIQIR